MNSRSWWWTGRPGVLRFMGSQRVGHDWATDLIWSDYASLTLLMDFPGGTTLKNPPANAENVGSILGSGICPGEGNGNPLQYSCLEDFIVRGAWWATVHGVPKNRTGLSTHAQDNLIMEAAHWFTLYLPAQCYSMIRKKKWLFVWGVLPHARKPDMVRGEWTEFQLPHTP